MLGVSNLNIIAITYAYVPAPFRFTGSQPEPRPGLSSGHMPYAKSLPFTSFLETRQYSPEGATEPVSYTTMKSNAGLHEALEKAVGPAYAEAILKGERGAVASCGSGMTAGVIWLALKLMGAERVGLYDEVRLTLLIAHLRA